MKRDATGAIERDVGSRLASLAISFARRRSELAPLLAEAWEVWHERAAIRQYLGDLPRPQAEWEAVNDTISVFNARARAGARP